MNINLLSSNPFSTTSEVTNVTEFEFWQIYLRQTEAIKGHKRGIKRLISNGEINVLSYLLANNLSITYFKTPHVNHLIDFLSITRGDLNQIRIDLVKKKFIEKDDVNGEYFLNTSLCNLQKYVRNRLNNSTIVNFQLRLNVERTDKES